MSSLFAASESARDENRAPAAEVVERGQDFAIYSRPDGSGRFTLLENALHYFEEGQWKESEDLIEPFPGGAVARRGPNKAIFSGDLNSEAVFDIETSKGARIRGGVRAIQATDFKSGKTVTLGAVKESVKGELFAPNRLVYASAFEGIEADLVLVWKHNLFSHDVVLREQPVLPTDWDPVNVRLEVVTEFQVQTEPEIRSSVHRQEGQPELQNDAVIGFGGMTMIMGKAFEMAYGNGFELGAISDGGHPVVKEWQRTGDGRRFLIESLSWQDASAGLKNLPAARQAANSQHENRMKALASVAAKPQSATYAPVEPVRMASASRAATGFVLDFTIVPDDSSPTTFLSGNTYYVRTSYYSGSAITFQPGTVVKYKTNANMVLYGSVNFSATTNQMMAFFTSRNDDTVGEVISANNGEAASDGNPANHIAAQALWLYYPTSYATIKQARFSWAKTGVRRDRNSGDLWSVTLTDCIFANITNSGSAGFAGDSTYLTSARLRKCNVTNAGLTMSDECGPYVVANFAGSAQSDTMWRPPDTQAAAGPSHIMELLNTHPTNGVGVGVSFFNKYTGAKQTIQGRSLDQFFAVTLDGTNYSNSPFDPRLVYDVQSERWFAVAITKNAVNSGTYAILAVSKDADPVGDGAIGWVENKWIKHLIDFPGSAHDFTTLGVDANGVYVSVIALNSNVVRLAAIPKETLVSRTNSTRLTNYIFPVSVPTNSIPLSQKAAFTPIVYDGAVSDPQWYMYMDVDGINYRRITWSGGVPSIEPSWSTLSLVSNGTLFTTNAPQKATGENAGSKVFLQEVGSRLTTPVSRNFGGVRYIWTCRTVMVNSSGGTSGADRTAIDYIRITPSSTPSASNLLFFDTSTTAPVWYYFPSIAVNKGGEILIGCSASSTNQYIGAYYTARLGSSSTWTPFRAFYPGKDEYQFDGNAFRWGDYSATFADADGLRLWMAQEYAETSSGADTAWGTRISALNP